MVDTHIMFKGFGENWKKDEFEKTLYSEKIIVRMKKRFFTKGSTNDEIENSQMGCECYTRYKSNPIYQIG